YPVSSDFYLRRQILTKKEGVDDENTFDSHGGAVRLVRHVCMLISTAENKEPRAKSSMTAWGLGPDAHHFENSVPGFSHIGNNLRIMDLNVDGAVANDLKACAAFEGGLDIAKSVECPTMCVLAGKDKMTPVKFGKKLAETLPNNILHVLKDSGHTIPAEKPHELNELLREFVK
ncbi:MAG: alpha/beta hydrolase, partial [Pseudomonadota bacterium]